MKSIKIMVVFGTRPEAIKMAPVIKSLKSNSLFEVLVCVTGQHREMLDQVLSIFEIKPNFDLDIMKPGQDLFDITSKVLLGLKSILKIELPDLLLVHGDTTTSVASALAAYYMKIPVGHVEAGLRTYKKYSPWPEEINRQLTSRLATIHFAPTEQNKRNLLQEGIEPKSIFITGNTVIDALHLAISKIKKSPSIIQRINQNISDHGYDTKRINNVRKIVLITGHRRENFGDGLLQICNAIKELAEKLPEVDFIYPVHPNPNVKTPIETIFGSSKPDNVFFIKPLEYLSFIYLMEKSHIILTDSGGIQEEAPSLKKPVLVMRDTTERPEALDAGTIKLVGTNKTIIINEVLKLIRDNNYYQEIIQCNNPYGDGFASRYISEAIIQNIDDIAHN